MKLPTQLEAAFLHYCEDVTTPRSLAVYMMVKAGEWDQLVQLKTDPGNYSNPERYWMDASVTSFFKKTEDLPTSFDRDSVAVSNFWKSEHACLRTNLRFAPFLENCLSDREEEGVFRFFSEVRKEVGRLLGVAPLIDDLAGKFGPGATYGDPSRLSTIPDKMSSRPTLTPKAYPLLVPWTLTAWARALQTLGQSLEVVNGNRFVTVPKDCQKSRGIAIEPSINVFYQLALGSAMKKRLLRWGIDLSGSSCSVELLKKPSYILKKVRDRRPDGQTIHKRVACEASISGQFATIDLSNASDTVAKDLVKFLVPSDWYKLLDSLRSPTTLIGGKTVWLEKFSSMGNGFTFELETAIFACISRVACQKSGFQVVPGKDLFTYGDDIIIPTECARNVIAALRWAGFSVNSEKSFVEGPFRESCGGDYFGGVDVRPFFLKSLPYEPQHYIAIANGIRRMAGTTRTGSLRWDTCRRFWFGILDALPSNIRDCRGPQDLGDLVVHDESNRWQTRQRGSRRYFRCYRPARYRKVEWWGFAYEVHMAYALYNNRFDPQGVIPKDGVAGYKRGWVERN